MAISGETLLVTLAIDFAIGLGAFLLFSVLRIIKPTKRYYNPRSYYHHRPAAPPWVAAAAATQSSSSKSGQPGYNSTASVDDAAAATAAAQAAETAVSQTSSRADAAAVATAVFEAGIDDETGLSGVPPFWAPLPPQLPGTLLTWIWPLLRLSEARLIAAVGLDVAMLLRFILFSLKLLLMLSIWCIGVVLPVNFKLGTNLSQLQSQVAAVTPSPPPAAAPQTSSILIPILPPGFGGAPAPTGSNTSSSAQPKPGNTTQRAVQLGPGQDVGALAADIASGRYLASNLDRFSLANIPAGSHLLWVHVASVYVVTGIILWMLWGATSSALRLYLDQLSSAGATAAGATHTALVRDIPGVSRGTLLDQVLHGWLFKLLPPVVKRRLRATWRLRFAGYITPAKKLQQVLQQQGHHLRRNPFRKQHLQRQQQHHHTQDDKHNDDQQQEQEQQEQEQLAVVDSSTTQAADADVTVAGVPRLSGSDGIDAARKLDQEQDLHQQQQHEEDQVFITIPLAGASAQPGNFNRPDDTAAGPAQGSDAQQLQPLQHADSSHTAADHVQQQEEYKQQQHHQQQQQPALGQAASGNAAPALSAAVALTQQTGTLYGEWRRAADSLKTGMSLQDFVRQEFEQVYGPNSIVAVHIVSFSSRTTSLVQQYNATRTALQDLLDHYNVKLQAAAAAAALSRHPKQQPQGLGVLRGLVAAPFKSLARALALLPGQLPHPVVAPAAANAAAGAGGGSGAARAAVVTAGVQEREGVSGPHHDSRQRLARGLNVSKLKPVKVLKLPLTQIRHEDKQSGSPHKSEGRHSQQHMKAHQHDQAAGSHKQHSNGMHQRQHHQQHQQQQQREPLQEQESHLSQQPFLMPFPSLNSSSSMGSINNSISDSISNTPGGSDHRQQTDNLRQHNDQHHYQQTGVADSAIPANASVAAEGDNVADGAAAPEVACKHVTSNSAATNDDADETDAAGNSSAGGCGLCCKRRQMGDALDVLLCRMAYLRHRLSEAQKEAEEDPYPAALITFRTRTALAAAVGAHHVAEASSWHLSAAPPPDSLMWSQLGLRAWQVGFRRGVTHTVLLVVAFFYVIPVGAVQGLLQLEKLSTLPVIGTLVSLPVVHSLLVGVLPGLALRIFVQLLPVLLYALNRRSGAVGQAEMDGHVATQFFTLQVVTVFFASFITGSLLNQLALLLTNPQQVLTILGTGVPQTANFFMLYIIFSAFVGRSWMLLRPWGLLMTAFRLLGARKAGKRGRRRAVLVATYRMFGPSIPEHSIILLLSVVFCVIAPLVLVTGIVFFLVALPVETYNWGWVFRRPYEGGGELWKQVFRQVMIALYLFQLVMIALLIVKRFIWVVLLLIPLGVTIMVHRIGSRLLQRSWGVMSMRAAHELDVADAAAQPQQQQQQLDEPQHQHTPGVFRARLADGTIAGEQTGLLDRGHGSLARAWGELYRPPGEHLMLIGPSIEQGLGQQVRAMQQRLAVHNAAASRPRMIPMV